MKRPAPVIVWWVGLVVPLFAVGCSGGDDDDTPYPPGALVGTSDVWYRTFGGPDVDEAWGIDLAANGDIFLGTHQGNPDTLPDAWIYRITPAGEILWSTRWDASSSILIYIVRAAGDTLYAAGSVYTMGVDVNSVEPLVLALDQTTGAVRWSYTWSGDAGYSEVDGLVIDDDAVYASGWATGETSQNDVLLLKLTLDGELVWDQIWGTDGWDDANGHMEDDGDRLFVTGRYDGADIYNGGDAYLAAFNKADGAEAWHVTWGDESHLDQGLGMTREGDALYLVGSRLIPFAEDEKLLLWKYDLAGNLQWQIEWDGDGGDHSRAIDVDPEDGHIIVAATTNSNGAGKADFGLLEFDADGTLLDEYYWGGSGSEEVHDIVLSGHSGFVAGQTDSIGRGSIDAVGMRFSRDPWKVQPIE